jgi:hypothetical protein
MPLGVLAVFLVGRRLMKSEAEPLLKVSMGYKIENGSIILPNKTPNAQSVALEDGTSASLWWTLCVSAGPVPTPCRNHVCSCWCNPT